MKEGTKIGKIDETDVTLILSEKLKIHLEFDRKQQRIMVRKYHYDQLGEDVEGTYLQLPDELKQFLQAEDSRIYYGSIDVKQYFFTFIKECYEIISSGSLELPEGLALSTKFTPCEVCKNTDNIVAQYVRCRHQPGCEEHKKTSEDPSYKEKCQCRNFTSPCLSVSKIGLVLHLEFNNKNKSVFKIAL